MYQVQRLQSHPSIVLWGGNNEGEMILAIYTRTLPPEEQEAVRNDYRKLYIHTVMAAVTEIDPSGSRPFVASSPSNGIESVQENYTAKNPEDPLFGMSIYDIEKKTICLNLGDVHYYNYNTDTWDGDIYPITRFLSETGVQSMPSLETWQQATNVSEDFNFTSAFVEYRDHHGNGQQEMMFVSDFHINSFFL